MTIKFCLKNGTEIIPTSFHGCRFSDGTEFAPTPEQIEEIKREFSCLKVDRKFSVVREHNGMKISHSTQIPTPECLAKLRQTQAENPDALVLVSFMILSALHESGLISEFPNVVGGNSTPETSRETPDKKVWDINNWAQ